MKKILLKINKDEELDYQVDGYIIGIKNYSICFEKCYTLDEIKKIRILKKDKKIFVSLNKLIYNDELKMYKKTLKELDSYGLDGIIVGDVSALTYDLKTNLILDQMHLNNSYLTINHYANNNLYGIVLTNDITLDEINEIKKNTKMILFKQVFGLPHLSSSVRKLVSNYLKHYNISKKDDHYLINEKKDDHYYHVVEDEFGTHILGDKVLNLLSYQDKLSVDYLILDSFLLDSKNISLVVNSFMNCDIKNDKKINNLYNADNGFIEKQTIYKVKHYE